MHSQAFVAFASLQLLCLASFAIAHPTEQQPIELTTSNGVESVRYQLKKANIIPTVIDDFSPSLILSVSWGKNAAELGNTIKPKYLQDEPKITLHDSTDLDIHADSKLKYVVTLTDPDAPSRGNPEWSEFCHWIATNVTISKSSEKTYSTLQMLMPVFGTEDYNVEGDNREKKAGPDDLVEYKPPGPPKKTGKHRYVFLVFSPRNGTLEALNLSTPEERKHWGYGEERAGVRKWAGENGLVAVGANFVYAKNEVQ